jgi:hypothetical protein
MPGNDEHAQKLIEGSEVHEQSQVLPTWFRISKLKVLHMIKVRYTFHCATFLGQVQQLSAIRYFLQCGFYKPSSAHDQSHTLTV